MFSNKISFYETSQQVCFTYSLFFHCLQEKKPHTKFQRKPPDCDRMSFLHTKLKPKLLFDLSFHQCLMDIASDNLKQGAENVSFITDTLFHHSNRGDLKS